MCAIDFDIIDGGSVSYTHLDVYKRQASDWTGLLVMMGKTLKNRAFLSVVFLDMFAKIVYTVYAVEGKE